MCYAAEVWADYKKYARHWGAEICLQDFFDLYWQPSQPGQHGRKPRPKTPKALDAAFAFGDADEEHAIAALVEEYDQHEIAQLEHDLFKQRRRLHEAERALQGQTGAAALQARRTASDKIAATLHRLTELKRSELQATDSRIFPGCHAPVLLMENGRKIVKPMRFQCRREGTPSFYDRLYPDSYAARRDELEHAWSGQFGHRHALLAVSSFSDMARGPAPDERAAAENPSDQQRLLQFRPEPAQDLWLACLWSPWSGKGEADVQSFAVVTDAAPMEIAAAGADRCAVPIKPEHVDAWLQPDPNDLAALYAILDDRPPLRFQQVHSLLCPGPTSVRNDLASATRSA
jgi:putative SOS response-associated peptidase YedK